MGKSFPGRENPIPYEKVDTQIAPHQLVPYSPSLTCSTPSLNSASIPWAALGLLAQANVTNTKTTAVGSTATHSGTCLLQEKIPNSSTAEWLGVGCVAWPTCLLK